MMRALLFVSLLLAQPAAAQYYWQQYQQPYGQPTHAPPLKYRHAPRYSTHHQRSAAEWKRSIQAQGKQFCAANPRDPICHH